MVPEPSKADPPGYLVTVHVPEEGKPFNMTLPVATAQVGCVMVPIVGADGTDIVMTRCNISDTAFVSVISPEAVPPAPSFILICKTSPAVHPVVKDPH